MENMANVKPNLLWIDNIRVIAVIAVIVVHVSAYGTIEHNLNGSVNTNWWIVNFYESLSRCCVPLFVMITGSLLLPQAIRFSDFLKKRSSRIVLPFIFWSMIYITFNLLLIIRHDGFMSMDHLGTWVTLQLFAGAEFHLWYVYMIIGLYLFIPVLQPWVRAASNKLILYFVGICVVTIGLKQLNLLNMSPSLDLRYFNGYIGYLVLGYYLSERMVISSNIRIAALILLILGFLVTFLGTYLLTNARGAFVDTYYDYLTLNVLALSIGFFILIKSTRQHISNKVVINARNFINTYGFGIYLCHPFLLIAMTFFKINYRLFNPSIGIPITTSICLILSCFVIYILRKLPYGEYFSG
jgi:surface polysaccharide O-acyltransferase-like enzyme